MKKSTKQKCERYVADCNGCNLLSKEICQCSGDKCWYIKAKLNTQEKFDIIKQLNNKMRCKHEEI